MRREDGLQDGGETLEKPLLGQAPRREPDGTEERSGVQDPGKRSLIEMEPMDEQGVVLQHQSQNRDPLSYGLKVSFIFELPETSY